MNSIKSRLGTVHDRIHTAAQQAGRDAGEIGLLAVSKTRPVSDIRQAMAAGQRDFGENYLQDALEKIEALKGSGAIWHFIGRIQSNKTRPIAEHFDWVHSLESVKHARRLNSQRPESMRPLKVCLQVNVDAEQTKGGVTQTELGPVLAEIGQLERLELLGLMAIPAPAQDLAAQRAPFRKLRLLRDQYATPEQPLQTLSMGMSGDIEAAITEGSTLVRVGTAIFGPRTPI